MRETGRQRKQRASERERQTETTEGQRRAAPLRAASRLRHDRQTELISAQRVALSERRREYSGIRPSVCEHRVRVASRLRHDLGREVLLVEQCVLVHTRDANYRVSDRVSE